MIFQATKVLSLNVSSSPGVVLTGNPRYFISGISLVLNTNSVISGGGILSVSFTDAIEGRIWLAGNFFVPASAVANNLPILGASQVTPPDFLFVASNHSTLSVTLNPSNVFTGGVIIHINYGFIAV